jgi:hypothetical protein
VGWGVRLPPGAPIREGLNRDPLRDLSALRDIAHVFKGGEIVS